MKPKVVQYLDRGELPLKEGEALALYRAMRRARFFDEKALLLQRQGRLGVYAPFMGQEAAQVGVALALEEKDWVISLDPPFPIDTFDHERLEFVYELGKHRAKERLPEVLALARTRLRDLLPRR